MSEQEFIARLKAGDTSAYQRMFDEYYSKLCQYIFRLSHDRSLAEDIVQETMVTFWERRTRIAIHTSLKSYLFTACHHRLLQHFKKEKVVLSALDMMRQELLLASYHAEDAHEDLQNHRLNQLKSLIDQLPPKCREVFVRSKLEEKKYKEIALDLGISVKTVEGQMSKALRFLRQHASLFSFFL